jgi:hypothetical protein
MSGEGMEAVRDCQRFPVQGSADFPWLISELKKVRVSQVLHENKAVRRVMSKDLRDRDADLPQK